MSDEKTGFFQLILYSLFAGIVGVFVRLINTIDIYSIIFFRAAIASVFIFFVIALGGKIRELSLVSPVKTFLIGLFQGLSIFFYFTSLFKTSVSNAVFLLYTAPIFSVLFAKFLLKEEIEKETLVGIFITLLGIVFIIDPRTFSFESEQTVGNLMGLASGLFYSAMALTAKPLMEKVSGYYTAFWQYLTISVMFSFFVKIDYFPLILQNWWKLLIIGVLCTGIAFILFMEGIKKVPAQKIFIITALEPLAGSVLALILLQETPSFMAIFGALLILYGVSRVARKASTFADKV